VLPHALYRSLSISKFFCKRCVCGGICYEFTRYFWGEGGGGEVRYEFITDLLGAGTGAFPHSAAIRSYEVKLYVCGCVVCCGAGVKYT
jgi:hypothetical protein